MIKGYRVSGMLLLFMLMANISEASYITMETENKIGIQDDRVKVSVGVTNKGDEPAYNVRISTEINGKTESGPLKDWLEINEKHSLDLSIAPELKKPGKYPVIIVVDYTDQNQYPFTAISIGYLDFKESVVGRVIGKMEVSPIGDRGRLKVNIKNLEPMESKTEIRIVLPKEFFSPTPKKEVLIQPGTEQAVIFDINNISALEGSQYQIYAMVEYQDDKFHYANAIQGTIKVVKEESLLTVYKKSLIFAAALLVVIAVIINLTKRRK